MDATVGVILRTRDRPILLKRAIESVIRQTFQDWLMVIVNDGGSVEDVENVLNMFPADFRNKIKMIHNDTSLGISQSANLGVRSITTRFLAIHDDDDSWSPEFLNIAVHSLETMHAKYDQIRGVVARSNTVYEKLEGNIVTTDRVESLKYLSSGELVDIKDAMKENPFPSIAFLFYYETVDQVGLLDAELQNADLIDLDFHKRFLFRYDVAMVPEYLAFRHVRISSSESYRNHSLLDIANQKMLIELMLNQQIRLAMERDSNRTVDYENSSTLLANQRLLEDLTKRQDEVMNYLKYIVAKLNQ